MTALVDPGKSTLLDLLAGRKTIGERKGDILFSGVPPSRAFLRRYTGVLGQLHPQALQTLVCVCIFCIANCVSMTMQGLSEAKRTLRCLV
jgi:hypothetical protein